ncbi:uncharacterized protein LOC117123281 [Anneissia japonica]|uniref:uncharacterized protein LOC117123281 n=1 Tax=Anneissia japonica TaxID=1529436 RepID=UPI0014255401|nr:uncharacterized protein LOC117123281 [Anneissia japonica]
MAFGMAILNIVVHYYFEWSIILLITSTYFEWSCQQTLGLSGCPLIACDPSGGFSFSGNPPLSNVTLRWQNNQGLAGDPDLGCIGISNRIVCPLRTANSTLVGIDAQSGELVWRDSLLHFPSMPLMDFYSNTIACDGSLLVPFDSEGHLRGTPIPFSPPMNPVFSLTLTDNDAFIISGYDGKLVTYLMNGIIHASIFLKASIDGVNGTFVPIITPVVSGHRAYFLTQFRPDSRGHKSKSDAPIYRLYAVDILRQAVDRMKTIWFHTFNNSWNPALQKSESTQAINLSKTSKYYSKNKETHSSENQYSMLTKGSMIFLTLNTQHDNFVAGMRGDVQLDYTNSVNYLPSANSDQSETVLYGFNDTGSDYQILFTIKDSFIALSSAVGTSTSESRTVRSVHLLATTNTTVYKIDGENGKILQKIDLTTVFGEEVVLTSKMMVVTKILAGKTRSIDGDYILLAVSCVTAHCLPPRTQKHYVILVDMKTGELLWLVATPDDRPVVGQLIGISSTSCLNEHSNCNVESKDLIIAAADGRIFALGGN